MLPFIEQANASPHIEDEARLVGHPVRRPGRVPNQVDIHDADAGDTGDRVLDHLAQALIKARELFS